MRKNSNPIEPDRAIRVVCFCTKCSFIEFPENHYADIFDCVNITPLATPQS